MEQEIKKIKVKDLILWSENPRDPISSTASNQDVVNLAIADEKNKWQLEKLAREMGGYYDLSELPIVVYKDNKPIVYDGNRRVILAKIKLKEVDAPGFNCDLPEVDAQIPCDVCSEEIALNSIYRKHVLLRNTWDALERDIFLAYKMNKGKSSFLLLEETTGYITKNPILNQGFVKDEIFTDVNMGKLGIKFEQEKLLSRNSPEELSVILSDIVSKVFTKTISTRRNRGKLFEVLDQRTKEIISQNKENTYQEVNFTGDITPNEPTKPKKPRKTGIKNKEIPLFGEILELRSGDVNNLYSDMQSLYDIIKEAPASYSNCVYAIFRMGMRLLCETAMHDEGMEKVDMYVKKYFSIAKSSLSQDMKTLLKSQNVSDTTMLTLLHIGAHNYASSASKEQLLAISIIVGAMLKKSHGRKK